MATEEARGDGGEVAEMMTDPLDRAEMLREVLEGLRGPDKYIASKFHYDARGSELFEEITRLDEYYLTRTERALLLEWIPKWVAELRPESLVELGPGSADKSRIILDAMADHAPGGLYVPVDVSGAFLREVAERLDAEYEELGIRPAVADITAELALPDDLPEPTWIAFLGSTLGNFETPGAVGLLGRVAERLRQGDRFLLGVDLRPGSDKSKERLELAYNDEAGVTERFSLNVLRVLNRELGSDFDLEAFRYRSAYHEERGRIETYLESVRDQTVRLADTVIELPAGEAIRTEISTKYDRATLVELFTAAGLVVDEWVEDACGYYALVLGALPAE